MSLINTQELLQVADLARLTVSDEETDRLKQQLGEILEYVHCLDAVETADVEPMAHPGEVTNVLRPDEVRESLPRDQAVANAPHTDGRYFLVPPILEDR